MDSIAEFVAHIPSGVFTVLAALIAILGAFAVQRFIAFRNASIRFRAGVLTALSGLYPIPTDWPRSSGRAIIDVLKERFPALQAAVAEFRHALSKKQQVSFDKAWSLYHLGKDDRTIDQQDYWQYVPDKGVGRTAEGKVREYDNTNRYQDNFKKNVDHLLSFAKET